jgi:DHA2 family multidrug resistance protein
MSNNKEAQPETRMAASKQMPPPRDLENSHPGDQVWRPKYNPWLIGSAVSLAAFMEVLDTSIANVALPYMAGSLGASNDESTWVLTSYLVSNAIVLPISGWVADRVGRKETHRTSPG